MEEETACLKHALRVSCEGCEVQVRLTGDGLGRIPAFPFGEMKALILSPGEAAADCLFATAVLNEKHWKDCKWKTIKMLLYLNWRILSN